MFGFYRELVFIMIDCYGAAVNLLCGCCDVAIGFQWDFSGIAAGCCVM